nr:MAG TPA: hypothetical protein [Caudoviricetes sp.]
MICFRYRLKIFLKLRFYSNSLFLMSLIKH